MSDITIDSFKGIAPKFGKDLPPGFAETAQNCAIQDGNLAPLAKNAAQVADANHYNSMIYSNGSWLRQNNAFYCPWKINDLDLLIYKDTSGYLKKKVVWTITKTDISFDQASKEIRSAGGDFNATVLIEGIQFTVSGTDSNDGTFTVSSTATTSTVITVDEAVVDEAVGDTVVITVSEEDYLGQTRQDAPTLTADETLGAAGWWLEVAPLVTGYPRITSTAVVDGEIYGVCEDGGYAGLLKWDGASEWSEVAAAPSGETTGMSAICAHSGEIYTGSATTGKVYKFDGVNVLEIVGAQLGAETKITALISSTYIFPAGRVWAATYPLGKLYYYSGAAWVQRCAQYGAETTITALAQFGGFIYGAGGTTGRLLKATTSWASVASQVDSEIVESLAVYGGYLYGGTSPSGKLFQWDNSSAWAEVCAQLGDETAILSLISHNDIFYGGTYPNGKLYKYESTGWIVVASVTLDEDGTEASTTSIYSMSSVGAILYAGSGANGSLLQYVPASDPRDTEYLITLTRNVGGHIDESGPGTVSATIEVVEGQPVTVTKPTWTGLGTSDYVTHWNLYRSTTDTGAWQLVAQIAYGTSSYIDSVHDEDLGGTPSSYYTSDRGNEIIWDIPQQNFDGITTIPMYGMLFAWYGGNLYWCEPGYPDAWPGFYDMNFPDNIKNVIPFGGSFAVLTAIAPFAIHGNNPEELQQSPPIGNNPATSIYGCCRSTKGVYYLTDGGIALFDLTGAPTITDVGFGKEWFQDNVSPTGCTMIEIDNVLYVFHSAGGLIIDFRAEVPICTTLNEVIYACYMMSTDQNLYVMDGTGIQLFGGAEAGTKAMTWKSGELIGDDLEEKTFIETELMSDSEEAVTVTNYVDGTSSASAELAMDTVRDKRLGFLDTKCIGRAAQFQIYKAADDELTPSGLEITEAVVRYTR